MSDPHAIDADSLPEMLQDWRDIAAEVLAEELSISADQAQSVGLSVIMRIANEYGSQQFYFAKGMLFRLAGRDRQIATEFNGRNFAELARRHKVSERHVRRLVKRVRALELMEHQGDMFPGRAAPNRR